MDLYEKIRNVIDKEDDNHFIYIEVLEDILKEYKPTYDSKELKIRSLERAIKKLLNGEELGTGLINTLFGYGLINGELPKNKEGDE